MDRFIFVWDCDSGLLGHVRYALGKLRGRSCTLCDLSYRGVRPSPAFDACRSSMPILIESLYRDQLSDELAAMIEGRFPAVVFERGGAASILLGPDELARLESFEALEAILRETVDGRSG